MQQDQKAEKAPYLASFHLRGPKKADVLIVFAAMAAVYLTSFWDFQIAAKVLDFQLHDTAFRRAMNVLGKAEIALLFVFLLCWITGNRRFLWRFLCSGLMAGIIVLAMKLLIARERPRAGGFDSFPSGHTQVAFVWATIVAAEFPKFAIPAFVAAFCIGLFRISVEAHFLSDVIAGAAIGFFVARMVVENIETVPRWVYGITRRRSTGLAGVAAFILYMLLIEQRMLLAAAVIVPVAVIAVLYRDRKSLFRYFNCRMTGKSDQ